MSIFWHFIGIDLNTLLEMPDLPEEQQQQVVVTTDNAANIKGAVQQSSMHHIRCLLVNWTAT